MFLSVLTNELLRSSEFISFDIQKLVKAHVNSKQGFLIWLCTLNPYSILHAASQILPLDTTGTTVVNENCMRISKGQNSAGGLGMRI